MKLTRAQRARLLTIRRGCDKAADGICSKYDAGYPNGPMRDRMRDIGAIEHVYSDGYRLSGPDGFKITDAGRTALDAAMKHAESARKGRRH